MDTAYRCVRNRRNFNHRFLYRLKKRRSARELDGNLLARCVRGVLFDTERAWEKRRVFRYLGRRVGVRIHRVARQRSFEYIFP